MDHKKPEFIFLDIETSPILGYVWRTYQDNVLKIIEPSKIMSVSWKRPGEVETYVKTIHDYPDYKPGVVDDHALVQDVWELLDNADIVCAHYGDKFDLPKLNARFVYYGLNAPSPFQTIDTKKVASKYFKFDSNSLGNLGEYLGCGHKLETGGFDLWDRCIQGDTDAWNRMADYNTGDVALLEQVYLKLRPFIQNHPDMNIVPTDEVCKTCQSSNVTRRGYAFTKTGKKQRFQCNDCASWFTGGWEKNKKTGDDGVN